MRIVRTITELRAAIAEAKAAHAGAVSAGGGATVGLVPTMGALHEGHLTLAREARWQHDVVVMSIFVNPTQFNEAADLSAYPRQEAQDAGLAESAGVDLIFAPDASEMYPAGYATTVSVRGPITETLEGAERGTGHFDGVATVVSKLLIAAMPDAAYFGQKDAQQLVVVRRMVADLGLPVKIVAVPISRDPDGLARSSRNVRLSDSERLRALAIPNALVVIERAVGEGITDTDQLQRIGLDMLAAEGIEPEYLAFVDPDTLEGIDSVVRPTLCAIAARVGDVRLIDNTVLGGELGAHEEH